VPERAICVVRARRRGLAGLFADLKTMSDPAASLDPSASCVPFHTASMSVAALRECRSP